MQEKLMESGLCNKLTVPSVSSISRILKHKTNRENSLYISSKMRPTMRYESAEPINISHQKSHTVPDISQSSSMCAPCCSDNGYDNNSWNSSSFIQDRSYHEHNTPHNTYGYLTCAYNGYYWADTHCYYGNRDLCQTSIDSQTAIFSLVLSLKYSWYMILVMVIVFRLRS